MHKNVVYNTRVVALDGKIVLIRPKLVLCDEDNYRETRWFTAWTKVRQTEDFYLPRFIRDVTGQTEVRTTKSVAFLIVAGVKLRKCWKCRKNVSTANHLIVVFNDFPGPGDFFHFILNQQQN